MEEYKLGQYRFSQNTLDLNQLTVILFCDTIAICIEISDDVWYAWQDSNLRPTD